MSDVPRHIPVLQTAALEVLSPVEGETVLDVTIGLGGHAYAFLQAIGPSGHLLGLDADEMNLALANAKLEQFQGRVTLTQGNFLHIGSMELPPLDVLFADLGLSSPHIDDPARGFTFRVNAPLDMRYDRTRGRPVSELLDRRQTKDVAHWLKEYGQIPRSGPLAHRITGKGITTTTQLKEAVEEIFGYKAPSVLPQVFQALRIAVNSEIEALEALLSVGPTLLKPGGRMGVISYHSLEDRLVKQTFVALTTGQKDDITGKISIPAGFELITRKALLPSEEEITKNPRSRSAKFRAIRRLPTL